MPFVQSDPEETQRILQPASEDVHPMESGLFKLFSERAYGPEPEDMEEAGQ